jgi:hypothetical protein
MVKTQDIFLEKADPTVFLGDGKHLRLNVTVNPKSIFVNLLPVLQYQV